MLQDVILLFEKVVVMYIYWGTGSDRPNEHAL